MIDVKQMRAIVLAAGLGKRMRPLTDSLPKPLIEVGGKCLVDHALDFLVSAGVADAVVNTHYLAPLLQAHLLKRHQPRIQISYEKTLLETGGGVLQALPMLGEGAFFSINSDTICVSGARHALLRLAEVWDDEAMDALLLLHPTPKAVGYAGAGDFSLTEEGLLTRRKEHETAAYVFTGVQILHPRVFKHAPAGSFSLNVIYNQLMQPREGEFPRIRAIVHDGKWLHVGDPQAIALAEAQL